MKILNKGKHLNIYNIGTTEQVTIIKVAKLLAKYFNKKIIIVKESKHIGSTTKRCPDIKKISKLGYKPKVKLNKGIKSIADWYIKNSHLNKKKI